MNKKIKRIVLPISVGSSILIGASIATGVYFWKNNKNHSDFLTINFYKKDGDNNNFFANQKIEFDFSKQKNLVQNLIKLPNGYKLAENNSFQIKEINKNSYEIDVFVYNQKIIHLVFINNSTNNRNEVEIIQTNFDSEIVLNDYYENLENYEFSLNNSEFQVTKKNNLFLLSTPNKYESNLEISLQNKNKYSSIIYKYQNQTLKTVQISVLKDQSEIVIENLPNDLQNNYEFANEIRVFPFAEEIEIQLKKKTKTINLIYQYDDREVENVLIDIPVDQNFLNIDQLSIPNGYQFSSSQAQNIEVENTIYVKVVPKFKLATLNFKNKNNLIFTKNLNIPFYDDSINLDSIKLPENYEYLEDQNLVIPFASNIEIEIKDLKRDLIFYINTKNDFINEIYSIKDELASEISNQITNLYNFINSNLEDKTINELKNFKNIIGNLHNDLLSYFENKKNELLNQKNEIEEQIVSLQESGLFVENFKTELDLLNDSISDIKNINSYFDNKNIIQNKIDFLKDQISNFENTIQNMNFRQPDYYKIYPFINYPLQNGSYLIGKSNKAKINLFLKTSDFSAQNDLSLPHLYKLLRNGDLYIQYRLAAPGQRPPYIKINFSDIDFLDNAIYIPYNSTNNEDLKLQIRIVNNQNQILVSDLIDKNNQLTNIFIRSGDNVDETPEASTVVLNSLNDYWIFPRKFSINFREILETSGANSATISKLNQIIRDNSQNIWNYTVKNNAPIKYVDSLWIVLLKFFTEINFKNSNFELDNNQTIFTSPFNDKGSFEFQIKAKSLTDLNFSSIKWFGGSFFEYMFESTNLKNIQIRNNDNIKIVFRLNNEATSWNSNHNSRDLPEIINNSRGDLSSLKSYGLRGKYPFLANFYGNLTFELWINEQKQYQFSSNDTNQTHNISLFVLDKTEIDGRGVINIYTSNTRSSIS
ncbi:hypothetical protein [Mycoplasmopsis gallinarum]|uniref:Uncharacterized protein n=1 Tax=Mycoplasmopsis gallinarum TaxID=29557 RepID=A0A168RG78_9BACT|nr:hypothetical protein [Mycoplasmopsis gallinarum]OAB48954.1 hypothetical protein MGALLINA_02860 [Mycoplasmopsis gallinarum]